jgi:hypothetical protein
VAELFLAVRDDIPLHQAARSCSAMGVAERSLTHMRFQAFTNELLCLNVTVVPAPGRGKGNRMKMAAVVTPVMKPCGYCGAAYFGQWRSLHCSQTCRNLRRYHGPRALEAA